MIKWLPWLPSKSCYINLKFFETLKDTPNTSEGFRFVAFVVVEILGALRSPSLVLGVGTKTPGARRVKTPETEIYKTINFINPNYIEEIFKMNESQNYSFRSHNALKVGRIDKVRNSLRTLGQQIWISRPDEYKTAVNLNQFKQFMKLWSSPKSSCNIW